MATKKAKAAAFAEPLLRHVEIRGFSLLRDVSVEFSRGLTVITGASGAGKSLLFDAISFALGGRAHRALLAAGSVECSVNLSLWLSVEQADRLGRPWRQGLNSLSRNYASSGRTRLSINGEAGKLADLENLLRYCVELTGQFESLLLFNPAEHLKLLDAFGEPGFERLKQAYVQLYLEFQSLRSRLNTLQAAAGNRAQEIEFLSYQCAELRKAAVKAGEKSEVEAQLRLLQNAQALTSSALRSATLLSGDEAGSGARDLAASAFKELESISRLLEGQPEFAQAADRLQGVLSELDDIAAQCRDFAAEVHYDPQAESRLSERLDEIHRLERKYACAADALEGLLDEKAQRLEILTDENYSPEELERQLAALRPKLLDCGGRLRAERTKAARTLEASVAGYLRRLEFPEVSIEAGLAELSEPGPEGLDSVELLISLNPGEPPRGLAQVVSGGEASRILLALKAALADRLPYGVMLLDEIEAGLGADSAGKVAEVLRELAVQRQVLAITHLPAVAAAGDQQLLVSKAVSGGRTSVSIGPADENTRLTEIMRMLGGESRESEGLARRLLAQ